MVGVILWRIWKWIMHFLTGKCELHRISESASRQRNSEIVKSLSLSRSKVLRGVGQRLGVDLNVDTAVNIIIREKSIKPVLQQQFIQHITPCLVQVSGVKDVWVRVEAMRAESYQQSNQSHENHLIELWRNLMPGQDLTNRISKQWQELGFQGDNPATDFRGMGLLGLQCLVYFSTQHNDMARSTLLHSKHPKYWYPFAVVGIDLTGVLYTWLKDGTLNPYLFSNTTEWPIPTSTFFEMFCFVICKFDSFWASCEPENIMAFPQVKTEFLEQLKSDIAMGNIVLCL